MRYTIPMSWPAAIALLAVAMAGCAEQSIPEVQEADLIPAGSHVSFGYPAYLPPLGDPDHDRGVPEKKPLPSTLSGLEFVTQVEGITGGAGISIFGNYLFAGPQAGPLTVVDISEPTSPKVRGSVDVPMRDSDTIAYPDGRLVVVTTGGGAQMFAVDVTDPDSPFLLSAMDTPNGSHNLAIVPGTPVVYNSPSKGGSTDIWNLTDPENPILEQDWGNGHGCHDITFYNDPSRHFYRAYCAGIEFTQIWNTTDVLHPQIVAEIPFPPPGAARGVISHTALANHDASILVVGDEIFGDCTAETLLDGTLLEQASRVNIWFYDITNEAEPVLRGHISPTFEDQACTSHFGRVVEDRNHFVMGFYTAGTLLIDFTDPDAPRVVDQYTRPSNAYARVGVYAWDAWYYQGYVFTGDVQRGVDVLTFG